MPRDGFPLAIGVSRQIQIFGFFQFTCDGFDVLFIALDHFIIHFEVIVGFHRTFLGDQVAYMAVGGKDLEILAEVFFYGFGFCRGLYYDEVATHRLPTRKVLKLFANGI